MQDWNIDHALIRISKGTCHRGVCCCCGKKWCSHEASILVTVARLDGRHTALIIKAIFDIKFLSHKTPLG